MKKEKTPEQREVENLKAGLKKKKRKKIYNLCTWYPHECNAAGCDLSNEPCRDFIAEDSW